MCTNGFILILFWIFIMILQFRSVLKLFLHINTVERQLDVTNLKQNTHVLYILSGKKKRLFRERDWGKGNKKSHKFLDELLNVFIAMIYRHFYGNHL